MGRFGEVLSLLALLGTLMTTLAYEEEGEEVEVLADDDWTEGWAAISFTFLIVVSGYIVGDLPSNCIHQGPDAWRCAHEKSTYIAPEPVYGVVMVGGKEKSRGEGWPVETFPRDTCAVKIPDLGTNYGEEWYFFTLSWISRLNTNRDDMLVACGGNVVGNKSRCISWQQGQSHWSHYATTQHARSLGQAATMADGSILLFGGQVDLSCDRDYDHSCTGWTTEQTVEKVTPDGSSEVIYALKHDNKGGCALQMPSHGTTTVFLLGGGATYWTKGDPHAHVEAYDETGHLGSLPDMLQPRFEHACAYYKDNRGHLVLMVAGGAVDQLTKDTATNTVELLVRPGRASSWIAAAPLPRAQAGVRAAANLNFFNLDRLDYEDLDYEELTGNSGVILTGIGNSVLKYKEKTDETADEWEEVGTTKNHYSMHTTLAGDLASLCQPSARTGTDKPRRTYAPAYSQAPAPPAAQEG